MKSSYRVTQVVLMLGLALAGCAGPAAQPLPSASSTARLTATGTPPVESVMAITQPPSATGAAPELPVTQIPLTGPLLQRDAEVSGLAWYGDYLILLPQYPNFSVKEDDGAVYALPRGDLLAYLDGTTTGPLLPLPIPFIAPGLAGEIDGYEGYEAIAFLGDQAFLTIEADTASGMRAYLVSGRIAPDFSTLRLDTATRTEIPPQSGVANMSDEALLVAGDRLVTIYEANGAAVNPFPVAHLFNIGLIPTGTIPFAQIEYRITDATALDGKGRFWAINYFFPGDIALRPERDPLAERYGWGPTHTPEGTVERLVEFQFTDSGIDLVDRPPLQLELPGELLGGLGRNWEGLVRLNGRGFLLVTDTFPDTILAFVPVPEAE